MEKYIDSWKNKNCFIGQLNRNLIELKGKYPTHWVDFLTLLRKTDGKSLLDIGCGGGAFYELCKKEYQLQYTGTDYSKDAIDVATSQWGYKEFYEMDYKDMTSDYIKKFDVLHMGALLDVLPNGDEALDYILTLKPKQCIITRIRFTTKNSYFNVYQTPYGNKTYEFYHNENDFQESLKKYNYLCEIIKNKNNVNSALLTKKV